MADPLGAFAERAGFRQRSLQSGLKLLKGKVSGTVCPGLQPARCSIPEQLVQQPRQVLEEVPRSKHQKRNVANDLQQYACNVDKQSHAKTRTRPTVQASEVQLSESDIGGTHSKPGASDHRKCIFSPKKPPSDVPIATSIDPMHFQKLKQSLCQLMQDRHSMELPADPTTADRPLITSLASKLNGADITATLLQHRNVLLGAQEARHDAPGNAIGDIEVSSASRSSVACTPRSEIVLQLRSHADPQCMPDHAASAVQHDSVEAPLSPASSSISSGFNRMSARQRQRPLNVKKSEPQRELPCFASFANTATTSPGMLQPNLHDWQLHDLSNGDRDPDGHPQHMQLAAPLAKLGRCTFMLKSVLIMAGLS